MTYAAFARPTRAVFRPSDGASRAALAEAVSAFADPDRPAVAIPAPVTLPVLEDRHDRPVDLTGVFAGRGLILTFYFGGWSAACMAAIKELASARESLAGRNVGILAVSPEGVQAIDVTVDQVAPGLLAVHDHGSRFAQSMGLAFRVGPPVRTALRAFGVRLADWNGEATGWLPAPASLLVTPDRRVDLFRSTETDGLRTDVPNAIRGALAA